MTKTYMTDLLTLFCRFGAVIKRESFEQFMFETLILDNAF